MANLRVVGQSEALLGNHQYFKNEAVYHQQQQLNQLRAQKRLQNQQRRLPKQNTRRQIAVRGGRRRRTFRKQKGGQAKGQRRRANLDTVRNPNGIPNTLARASSLGTSR